MNSEFSRIIKAGHIHETAQTHELVAGAPARAALAARFALPAIAALRGVFTLKHERGGIIAAQLHMQARVTQLCVITLEPFEVTIKEDSALRFVPAARPAPPPAKPPGATDDDEDDVTPESLDGPDEIPFDNDEIDLGEALAEQLALALDPYPRKPGAELPPDATDTRTNPFAALQTKFTKPD